MWAEHTPVGTVRVFFHGRPEHNPGLGTCCREVGEKQAARAAAFMAMQGKNITVSVWGCYSDRPCALCRREEKENLWTMTNEPPRPLDELFPTTQDSGENHIESENGSQVPPSQFVGAK